MTDLRKTAEIALRQLQKDDVYLGHRSKTRADAIEALQQALAEPANSTTDFVEPKASSQTEQESVMYIDGKRLAQGMPDWKPGMVFQRPKREWVGLTDEEIDAVVKSCNTLNTYKYFRAIEAKLKEKNA